MEFYLKDLSDAGQLAEFREFVQMRLNLRDTECTLRIGAKPKGVADDFMPTALYWRSELMRETRITIRAVLDGNVTLHRLVVWTGCASRTFTDDVRVSCWMPQRLIGRERDEAFLALNGAMACTDKEVAYGIARRDISDWLSGNLILGPEQLRRRYRNSL